MFAQFSINSVKAFELVPCATAPVLGDDGRIAA
jgi:hypothetical protein